MRLSIVTTLNSPGRGPAGLAWDGQHLWNADFESGRLFGLKAADGQVVNSLLCPGVLSGLTWDGHSLWQAVMDQGWLQKINPATHDFDRHIVVENAGRLSGVAWAEQQLWTVSQERGLLLALEPESGEVTQTIDVPLGSGGLTYKDGSLWLGAPIDLHFDSQTGNFSWRGSDERFALLEISIAENREVGKVELDFLPLGLAWVGNQLWLSNARTAKLLQARLV